MALKQCD